jgi:hypothetical protein
VARESGINFERYGAAALMMRLPHLRTALREAVQRDRRVANLCSIYGEAVLFRDGLRRKRLCEATLLRQAEDRCLQLEASVAHFLVVPARGHTFEILG